MRAAVLKATDDGMATEVLEWPVPTVGPGDVLVRVGRSGICGSDVHFALDGSASTAYLPIVLGHEAMGQVEARGAAVTSVDVGDRVSILPIITCGQCRYCRSSRTALCSERACIGVDRDGALAEFVAVPERNCVPVPANVPDEFAAVVTDAVATAYHAVVRRGEVGTSSHVAVWGVGGLGLAAVAIARSLGAARVTAVDVREEARAAALRVGADSALPPAEASEEFRGDDGVDVALEFVGTRPTAELAIRSIRRGGRAVLVGVGREVFTGGSIMSLVTNEKSVLGSYGSEPEEVRACLDLIAAGRLDLHALLGDTIPLAGVPDGLKRVQAGKAGGSRLLVDPWRP